MKDAELERRFLELVFTTDAAITVGAVAYHTGCTLEEAEAYLDRLASAGRLRLEHDDNGDLFYVYPNRPKPSGARAVAAGAAGAGAAGSQSCPFCGEAILATAKKCRHCGEYLDPALRGVHPRALVRAVEHRPSVHHHHLNPGTAAVLSFVWPGAGQIYTGRVGAGILWMIATAAGYAALIIPGLILHVLCMVSAARSARALNERNDAG